MAFTISDKLLLATHLTEQEMAAEIATILYHRGRLPVAAAAEVARMGRLQFQHLLAAVTSRWTGPIPSTPMLVPAAVPPWSGKIFGILAIAWEQPSSPAKCWRRLD
jgi:hypothetical protein